MKFIDKNGIEIKGGQVIFNKYEANPNQEIVEIDGILCFEEDKEPLDKKYQFETYWEVKDVMKCELCNQYFEKGDLGQVFYHEHKDLKTPQFSGSKRVKQVRYKGEKDEQEVTKESFKLVGQS